MQVLQQASIQASFQWKSAYFVKAFWVLLVLLNLPYSLWSYMHRLLPDSYSKVSEMTEQTEQTEGFKDQNIF